MAGVWKAGWVSGLTFLKDMSLKCACRLVLGVGDKKRHSWTWWGEVFVEWLHVISVTESCNTLNVGLFLTLSCNWHAGCLVCCRLSAADGKYAWRSELLKRNDNSRGR